MIRFTINSPTAKNTNAAGHPQTLRTRSYPYSCEWNGKTYSSAHHTSPLSYVARMLKADSCPDQPWEAVGQDKIILRGKSLDWLAEHVLVEDKVGVRWVTWKPFAWSVVVRGAIQSDDGG